MKHTLLALPLLSFVVLAGEPEGLVALHAMPAGGDVNLGVFEHVPDVEAAGDVGRRNDEGEDLARGVGRGGRAEVSALDPELGPVRLKPLRLIDFVKLNGETLSLSCGPR